MITIRSSGFILLFMLCSCNKNQYKTDWGGGLCHPSNYSVGISEIEFFNDDGGNLNIPGAFCGFSWNSQGQTRWFHNATLPDSVFVTYEGMNYKNQTCLYKGGCRLPKDKLIEIFKHGYEKKNDWGNAKESFKYITVGMAPGGRVCVWVDHVEISRFKIKEIKKLSDSPILLGDYNPEDYLKYHPINYSFWDKPDKRYDLDFGFCSEDGKTEYFDSYYSTKEGFIYRLTDSDIDKTQWNLPYNKPVTLIYPTNYIQLDEISRRDKKLFLPVQCSIDWKMENNTFYSTDVVMPKDLPIRFTTSYINPKTNKKSNYNRIIFGVEKDGEHCNVWLDGPGKIEKIIRFKGNKAILKGETLTSGGYATEVIYY